MNESHYAGFWIRAAASFIDTLLVLLVTWPLLRLIYGPLYFESDVYTLGPLDTLISYIFPAIAVIAFWIYKSATPGKMLLRLAIVDAKTGGSPTRLQFIGRYFAYYASMIPFFLGFVWVGIDKRKQGFHDKLAGTLVIYKRKAEAGKTVTPKQEKNEKNKTRILPSVERLH